MTSSFLITSHSSKGAWEPISPSEYMGLCPSLLLVAYTFNCSTWWWNACEQTLSWWSSYSYTIYLHAFTLSRQTSINTWWINFINPLCFCVMITVSKYKICFLKRRVVISRLHSQVMLSRLPPPSLWVFIKELEKLMNNYLKKIIYLHKQHGIHVLLFQI